MHATPRLTLRPWPPWDLSWRADVGPAAALLAIELVGTHFSGLHHGAYRPVGPGAFALVAVGPVALVLRRRHPRVVLAVVFSAMLAYILAGYPPGAVFLSLIVAFFTAAVRGYRLSAWAAIVAGFFSNAVLGQLVDLPPPAHQFPGGPAGLAGWLLALVVGAEVTRARRQRSAEATRARTEEARRRAGEERLRIARDLHDVIGHTISLINVQAGVGLDLMDERPEQARVALGAIKTASKEALGELRSVLDALRGADEQAPRTPPPGLASLDNLVARTRSAGLQVTTTIEGNTQALPAGVDLAAYRIVQEALTNVARHAGPAAARVSVTYGHDDLTVTVDDDGRGPKPNGSAPAGSGIPGMTERAAALGGHLVAGPRPGGGFRVSARLPVKGQE